MTTPTNPKAELLEQCLVSHEKLEQEASEALAFHREALAAADRQLRETMHSLAPALASLRIRSGITAGDLARQAVGPDLSSLVVSVELDRRPSVKQVEEYSARLRLKLQERLILARSNPPQGAGQ